MSGTAVGQEAVNRSEPAARSATATAGRLMVASLFWYSGLFDMAAHWPGVAQGLAERGFPAPLLLGGAAMAFEVLVPAGLFVPRARAAAGLALALYCIATALLFHGFWASEGADRLDASFHFFKNVALAGALLVDVSTARIGRGPP